MMGIPWAIHPFVFALFRVVSLYAHNYAAMGWREMLAPLGALLGGCAVAWLALRWVVKDRDKRGVLITLALFVYLFAPPLAEALYPISKGLPQWGVPVHTILSLALLAIPAALIVVWIVRTPKSCALATKLLNVIALCAVAIPLLSVGLQATTAALVQRRHAAGFVPSVVKGAFDTPDIYYIVLDGYAREDVFRHIYGGDNSAFLQRLRNKGFYIADSARANYCQTYLSLASSLNSTPLDGLAEELGPASEDRGPLRQMIEHSNVVEFLRARRYVFVAFDSGYSGTKMTTADVLLEPEESMSEADAVLANAHLLPGLSISTQRRFALHRARLRYTFERLADMPERDTPQFVFAHIVAPHPPFVFNADGMPVQHEKRFGFHDGDAYMQRNSREQYVAGYREQLQFISSQLEGTLDAILARTPDALILVQSDHGPGSLLSWGSAEKTNMWERLSILSAYYLPNGGHTKLYPDITPVNSFGVVFDHYFGTTFERHPDKSYYATYSRPYALVDVTARAKLGPSDTPSAPPVPQP